MLLDSLLHQASNFIGIIGVALVLFAYLLLQLGRMSAQSLHYSLLNVLGSVFILVSLYYHLNIASAVIEVAWLFISLYGLIKAMRQSA